MSLKKSLRVAHIIGSTGIYGAERWILAIIRSIDPRQVDSTIVNLVDTPGGASAIVQAAQSRNLKAVDFYTRGRFNPIGVFWFSKWVQRNNIDVIHAHGYKADIYSLLAARITKKKVISTPHGWSKEEKDWKLKLYETLDRWFLRNMDRVCPLSPELWKDLNKCGVNSEKNTYIPNGVDLDEVDQVVTHNNRPGETVIIGYVGQLIERKNIPFLFKAFRSVIKKRGDLQLWVAGDGPLQKNLREVSVEMGIESHVRFTGYCEDVLSLMKQFDVLVLPSQLEGIPRCIMEAMALGIPVVASDIPGNRELVEQRRTGLLFSLDDPGRLADAILYIIEHPEYARDMCRQAREMIEKQYSARRMAKDYLSLYKTVSGKFDQGCV